MRLEMYRPYAEHLVELSLDIVGTGTRKCTELPKLDIVPIIGAPDLHPTKALGIEDPFFNRRVGGLYTNRLKDPPCFGSTGLSNLPTGSKHPARSTATSMVGSTKSRTVLCTGSGTMQSFAGFTVVPSVVLV